MNGVFRVPGRIALATVLIAGMVVTTGAPAGAADPGAIAVTFPADLSVSEDIDTFEVSVERTSGTDDLTLKLVLSGDAELGELLDYTVSEETFDLAGGETDYTFIFTIIDDSEGENPDAGAETGIEFLDIKVVAYTVGIPGQTAIGSGAEATVEIADDITGDRGSLTLSLSQPSIDEGTASPLGIILTRTGGSEGSLSSSLQHFESPSRLALPVTTVIFSHGDLEIVTEVFPVDNLIDDGDALVSITATSADSSPQELTILDDDDPGDASFDSPATETTETDDTGFEIEIPVSLSIAGTTSIQVPVTASLVSNADSADFTLLDAEADFAPFSFSATVTVRIEADNLVEGPDPQIILLTLDDPSSGQVTHTITINDDDSVGTLSFDAASSSTTEADPGGDFKVSIPVTRTETDGDLEVNVAASAGAGVDSDSGDFILVTTPTITIPAGVSAGVIEVTIVGDNDIEIAQQVDLEITGLVDGQTTHTVTINDDDAAGTLQFASASVSHDELDSGFSGFYLVTVERPDGDDGELTATVSLDFSDSDATTDDVTLGTTSVTFGQDETAAVVSYTIIGDNIVEGDDTFKIVLGVVGETVLSTPNEFSVTIVDNDDLGSVGFALASADTDETDENFDYAIELVRTDGDDETVEVDVSALVGAGADSDSGDFIFTPQTVTFTQGQTQKFVNLTIVGDNDVEGDQQVNVTISGDTGGFTTHVVTIVDDDSHGEVNFAPIEFAVGEHEGSAELVVARTGGTDGAVSVFVFTDEGTAASPDDYGTRNQRIYWADQDGEPKSVFVTIIDDEEPEGGEDFTGNLISARDGVAIGASNTTLVTITDNDVPGDFTFKVAETDGNEADGFVDIIVERANGSAGKARVDFATGGGDATDGGVDYTETSGTLEWDHLEFGERIITVPITNDSELPEDEFFYVTLSNPSGRTELGDIDEIKVTIIDNVAPEPLDDDDFEALARDEASILDVLANDTDPNGTDPTIVAFDGLTVEGNTVVCSEIDCTVTPVQDFIGADSFEYAVTDGIFEATATVNIQIGPLCDIVGLPDVDDVLIGTSADEVICGLSGNDTIDGGGGSDILVGGPGDDSLTGIVGTTEIIGNAGNDTATFVATNASEEINASDSEIAVNGVETLLKSVETIVVLGEGGNDTMTVTPSDTVLFTLNGGDDFDVLSYIATGVNDLLLNAASITASNKATVTFTNFENVEADSRVFLGTEFVDTPLTFIGTDEDGLTVDLLDSGDSLTVRIGSAIASLLGVFAVADSGASGLDVVRVEDFSGTATLLVTPGKVVVGDEVITLAGIERLDIDGGGKDDTFIITLGEDLFEYELRLIGGAGNNTFVLDVGDRAYTIDKTAQSISVEGMPIIFYQNMQDGVVQSTVSGKHTIGVGYWMLDSEGRVYNFGDSQDFGDVFISSGTIAVKIVPTVTGNGYWVLESSGKVRNKGDAPHLGNLDTSVLEPGESAGTMAVTPDGAGYWIFTTRGRAQAFGTATHFGDLVELGITPNGAIVDSVSLPDGSGYYMVGTDGGVFAFGKAKFYGSMGGIPLNQPVNGLVPDPDGVGYWLVASDGGVFAFEAPFVGSIPGVVTGPLNAPVNGMVAYGDGYLMVASDGGIFNFSSLAFLGSLGGEDIPAPIVGVAVLDI